jgi:hypothetical protein
MVQNFFSPEDKGSRFPSKAGRRDGVTSQVTVIFVTVVTGEGF